MILNDREERLAREAEELLERHQRDERLEPTPETKKLVRELVASPRADLSATGLYLLSLMERDVDLTELAGEGEGARNVARFIAAEKTPEEGREIVETLSARIPSVRESFEDLSARRPAVPEAAPEAMAPVADMTIIVHGTFAATSAWWQPGGNFWNHVNGNTGNVYAGPDPFSWSGANRHGDRVAGAHDLVTWAHSHPATKLDVIAHSHGGNVCLLATRLGLKIRKLILLGTPIRLEYAPDLRNVEILHNVYSTHDRVQTPPGTIPNRRAEGRTLGDGLTTINHRATDDGTGHHPGHSELHEPATWTASGLDQLL